MQRVSRGRAAVLVATGVALAGLPGAWAAPALADAAATCPRVLSTTITPGTVQGGDGAVQTVRLAAPAAQPFSFVDLTSSDYAYRVSVGGGIRVPGGQSSISFPVRLDAPDRRVVEDVEAVNGQCSARAVHTRVTVRPLDPAKLAVSRVTFSRTGAVEGEQLTATVELTAPARSAGTGVRIFEYGDVSNSSLDYPFVVVVPAGRRSVSFPVTALDSLGSSRLAASLGSSYGLGSVFLSPDHLAVTGAVHSADRGPTRALVGLGKHAPAGGATVRVSTTSPGVHVPATVEVPAGAVGATFRITVDPGTDVNGKTVTVREGGRTSTTDLFFN